MSQTATRQRKLFAVNKYQLRVLLSINEGTPVSETTFKRLCKKWKLAEKLGMSQKEFGDTKTFYLEHYEKLKQIIGFTDADL